MGHDLGLGQNLPAPPRPRPPTSLAPGFRFHPTDEELVQYYLKRKACAKPFRFEAVTEIDVYKYEPWELQVHSRVKNRDLEWYFFSPVDRKYGNGSRLNRATGKGYWKATGKDRCVRHKGETIGMKKTLVFHSGRAPDGKRTNWVMHEYRLADEDLEKPGLVQEAFVVCRIFQKSGLGPPNGDRYAPFIEEEWDDEGVAMVVPGGDEMGNGDHLVEEEQDEDEANEEANEHSIGNGNGNGKTCRPVLVDLLPTEHTRNTPLGCKRERAEGRHEEREEEGDPEPISLGGGQGRGKRSKIDDPNLNGSEEDSNIVHDLCISARNTNAKMPSSGFLELPLLFGGGGGCNNNTTNNNNNARKDNNNNNNAEAVVVPFHHASNLEKCVPPGYLKFISNLENEILNVSMERETLKIEVMRAQAMINVLQSRIDLLTMENHDFIRRYGR